jgi:hypothetical protein
MNQKPVFEACPMNPNHPVAAGVKWTATRSPAGWNCSATIEPGPNSCTRPRLSSLVPKLRALAEP